MTHTILKRTGSAQTDEDGGSGGKNDYSSSQNDATGEEGEEHEDEDEVKNGEDKEHEDLEYGLHDSVGWVLEVKNFRIPIYGNNNATSACVLQFWQWFMRI